MLLVEIGADMGVFGSAERLASWVGICPGNNEKRPRQTDEEMQRRRENNLCFRCGSADHEKMECPLRRGKGKPSSS